MPIYVYECVTQGCAAESIPVEENMPIDQRDGCSFCAYCGSERKRKISFTGLTWAPTAGGFR